MLLGDSHVVRAPGDFFRQLVDTGPAAHGRGNADDFGIFFGQLNQRLREGIRVARDGPFFLFRLAGQHMKGSHAVVFDGIFLGRPIALSLSRKHVNQCGPLDLFHVF